MRASERRKRQVLLKRSLELQVHDIASEGLAKVVVGLKMTAAMLACNIRATGLAF
jgi:hypothetical protein